MKQKICIIIPAYNEGLVIQGLVAKSKKVFNTSKHTIDVVVVNDGSKDTTADEARKAGAIVIDHILNSGAGSATATGLSYATQYGYDVAATMDGDGQHDPRDVIRGVDELIRRNTDLLIGSRLMHDPNAKASDMSLLKRIGNYGLSIITFMLFGVLTTDSQSGMRIFSRKALEKLRWKTSGYEFCSEMVWRARRAKLVIEEYPIRAIYTDYSKTKGQNNWNGVNILKNLIKQRIMELFE